MDNSDRDNIGDVTSGKLDERNQAVDLQFEATVAQ